MAKRTSTVAGSTPRVAPFLVGVLVAGCTPPLINHPTAEAPAPPDQVVRVAERIFHSYQIPVEPYRSGSGILRSGTFRVQDTWRGVPIEERVHCGWDDDGMARARTAPVEFSVVMRARARRIGPVDDQRMGTRIQVEGSGRLLEQGSDVTCTLTRDFARELAEAIAAGAGGAPPSLWIAGTRG
jgi:hypothetical protein